MKKILKKILDIIFLPLAVIAVIFVGITILSNFLFTPKLFQKFSNLFPIIFSKKLFIILLLILIFTVGGIFAWQYFGIPEEEVADTGIYVNSQVGYQFEYPKTGLSLEIEETIKNSIQDLVQFATKDTTYGVRTYIGVTHTTIEDWITDPGIAKASSALSNYNKITVGSKSAYQYKAGLVVYVLASGNLYEITAHQGMAPSQNFADPIYNHLLSTFKFIEETMEDKTDNWQTYSWGTLEFKYPSTWTAEKIYYSTPAQQAKGESPENIGIKLFPGKESKENNFIAIGGRQISCDPSEKHTKCYYISSVANFTYTDSNSPEILKVFDKILSTFRFLE